MRTGLNLTKRPISMEEFEIAEEELDRLAKNEAQKMRHVLLGFLGLKTAWRYYLQYGHFPLKRTPFGGWYSKHPWYKKEFFTFNPDAVKLSGDYSALPVNIRELLEELFRKRYPKEGKA